MESARVAAAASESHAGAARRVVAASAGSVAVAVGLPTGAVVVARHRENLVRLRRGDERTLAP